MRAYIAFTKKEFIEMTRTYKMLIMGAVFLIIGMMNPITAKIMPELMSSFMPEGMMLIIPEPTAIDSWMQFYKNVPQMAIIVTVILFSGMLSNEFSKGTLINMLTKGLKRATVIFSKFTMATLIWSFSYLLCFGVSYAYTEYFWSDSDLSNIFFSALCLWLFGVLLISAMMLGGVLFKSGYGNLLFVGAVVVIMFILNMFQKLQKYNPLMLASKNISLIKDELIHSDFTIAITLSILLIVLFLIFSVVLFNKKKI